MLEREAIDKRKYSRIDSDQLVSYSCFDSNKKPVAQGMGKTINISESGALIEIVSPLASHDLIHLDIGLNDNKIQLKGRVVHSKSSENLKHLYGVHFVKASKSKYSMYKSFIESKRKKLQFPEKHPTPDIKTLIPYITGPKPDYAFILDEESYQVGETIIHQKSYGAWLWVIIEGTADIIRITENISVPIHRLAPGSIVGDLESILVRNFERNNTVIASSPVQLGILDNERLFNQYSSMSEDFQKLIVSMSHRLNRLINQMVLIQTKPSTLPYFSKQQFECHCLERNDHTFFIEKGHATLVKPTQQGIIPLISLYAGDIIGQFELADMELDPDNTYVVTTETTSIRPLDQMKLREEYESLPLVYKDIITNLFDRIRVTHQQIGALYKKFGI